MEGSEQGSLRVGTRKVFMTRRRGKWGNIFAAPASAGPHQSIMKTAILLNNPTSEPAFENLLNPFIASQADKQHLDRDLSENQHVYHPSQPHGR